MADENTNPGTTPADSAAILNSVRTDVGPGGFRHSYSVIGDWEKLKTAVANIHIACENDVEGPDGTTLSGVVASARLVHIKSDCGELTVTFAAPQNVEYWGVEMVEIQKNIRTWKADDTTDPPDLEKIARWEALKSTDWESYITYLWDGAQVMTGNTLKLAKMIHEWGIQSYPVHAPIAFRNTTWIGFPDDLGALLDQADTPAGRSGWTEAGKSDNLWTTTKIAALATKWVKTADRAVPNADGTWSRMEQWTGADALNPDLYPSAPADPQTKEPAA